MIGIDIVKVDRLAGADERMLGKILTPAERKYCTRAESVAGRFAAKEAIAKAFGTGIGRYISFQDIEILNNDLGAPNASVSKEARQRLYDAGFIKSIELSIEVSISHEKEYAVAMVMIGENDGI